MPDTPSGEGKSVILSDREVSAIRWMIPVIRGVEGEWSELAGVREGEATSDVLAGIIARIDGVNDGR